MLVGWRPFRDDGCAEIVDWHVPNVAPGSATSDAGDELVGGRMLRERTLGLGWETFAAIDAKYERGGEIDAGEWHCQVGAIIGPAHFRSTDPRAQSGSSNTPEQWELARRIVFACIDRDGDPAGCRVR
jgi:hypothetical protein